MAYEFKNHYEYRKHQSGHDEDLDHVPEFKNKVDTIVENAKSILFVGWRYDADFCYDHFDYTCKFATVTLVEAWKKNCEDFVNHNKWNYPVDVVCADVLDYIKTTNKTFDVCVWFDGPEHVEYEQFMGFLSNAQSKVKHLMISMPNGVYLQGSLNGNHFETHKTTWYDYMLENLGFEVTKWLASVRDGKVKENALMGLKKLSYDETIIPELGIEKPKLYIYPDAAMQSQDKINEYWNTVPMCIEGRKYFKIVENPREADLLFMGMISCGTLQNFTPSNFPYLKEYESKHIFELEGDWVSNYAPEWLAKLAKSGNSSKPEHLIGPLCVRPPISNLLIYLARDNPEYDLQFPESITWTFRGFPDPFGVRTTVVSIMQGLNLPGEYYLTNKFGARENIQSDYVNEYYSLLYKHLISLCPRGAGMDTVRFYESCFFGRVPVAISDAKWMGEDNYDMKFAYRLSPSLNPVQLSEELQKIHNTPYTELVERGKLARKYFQEVVIPYFKDPTLYFLKYLQRNKVL